MATTIKHKRSSVAGNAPSASDLDVGEIAINLADQKIYTKTAGGAVIELAPVSNKLNLQSGGGALDLEQLNLLTDSGTYTLPLANSVSAGTFILVEKSETYQSQTPTVSVSGSDNIRYSGGTDTTMDLDIVSRMEVRYVSNGTDEWSI